LLRCLGSRLMRCHFFPVFSGEGGREEKKRRGEEGCVGARRAQITEPEEIASCPKEGGKKKKKKEKKGYTKLFGVTASRQTLKSIGPSRRGRKSGGALAIPNAASWQDRKEKKKKGRTCDDTGPLASDSPLSRSEKKKKKKRKGSTTAAAWPGKRGGREKAMSAILFEAKVPAFDWPHETGPPEGGEKKEKRRMVESHSSPLSTMVLRAGRAWQEGEKKRGGKKGTLAVARALNRQ